MTITFHTEIGSSPESSRTATPGAQYGALPVPTVSGSLEVSYYFVGWYILGDANMRRVESTDIVPTGNITLEAFWGEKQIAITFDSNGGFVIPDDQKVQVYEYGKPYIDQYVTKQLSYTTKWGFPPNRFYPNSGGIIHTTNRIFQWGGLNGLDWGTVRGKTFPTELSTAYWGYVNQLDSELKGIANRCFLGWATAPNSSGKGYRIVDPNNVIDLYRSCTLYAQWDFSKLMSQFVFVDHRNRTRTTKSYNLTYGKTNIFPRPYIGAANRVFVGWFTLPAGKSAKQYIMELTGDTDAYQYRDLDSIPVGGYRWDESRSFEFAEKGNHYGYSVIDRLSGNVALVEDPGWEVALILKEHYSGQRAIELYAHFSDDPIYLELVDRERSAIYQQDTIRWVQVAPFGAMPTVTVPTADVGFVGYFTERNGQGKRYYDASGHPTLANWDSAGSGKLYAHYTGSSRQIFDITAYDYQWSEQSQTYEPVVHHLHETADFKYPDLPVGMVFANEYDGTIYAFHSWAKLNSTTGAITPVSSGASFTDNANVSLYTLWDFRFNNVEFILNGGSFASGAYPVTAKTKYRTLVDGSASIWIQQIPEEVSHVGFWTSYGDQYDPTIELYPAGQPSGSFTRQGYTFGGWYSNPDFTPSSRVTSLYGRYSPDTIKLYAKWTPDDITVRFDRNDGTGTYSEKTIAAHGRIGEMPQPERFGYRFDGWFTDRVGGTKMNPLSIVSSAITLFAHWTESAAIFDPCYYA